MTTLTVTAKGQITLKQDLLKHLGVTPGQKIAADKLPDGRVVVRAAVQNGSVGDFVGCLSNGRTRKLKSTRLQGGDGPADGENYGGYQHLDSRGGAG